MGNTNPVSEAECDDLRQKLADYAKSFEGCHYLWGSCGDAPGKKNGAPYRPAATGFAKSNTTPSKVSIFAALCNVGMGDYTCAGRYDHPDVKAYGGRESPPNDPKLKEYLDGLKDADGKLKDESQWGPDEDGLFPRLISKSSGNGKIVWGEDCRQKQHFDCIGFINYVYITKVQGFGPDDPTDKKHSDKGHNSIPTWASGGAVGGAKWVIAKPPDDNPDTPYDGVSESLLKPADVLIQRAFRKKPVMEPDTETGADGQKKPKMDSKTNQPIMKQKTDDKGVGITETVIDLHHIGMYAGDSKVIQANDSPVGVTLNNYIAKQWHYAVRLPCAKLILKD